MRKNKKFILVMILLISILGLLLLSSYFYINGSNNKATKISVIVYGDSTDRWATLKQGLDQGVLDFNVEMNFVTMTNETGVKEQEMLMEREIANGAKGIILAATDSENMVQAVRDYSINIPIVLVETNINSMEDLTYISADNYSMGLNIGRSVFLNSDEDMTIAVFVNNLQRSSVKERYEGLMDSLKYSVFDVISWEMGTEDTDASLFLQNKFKENPVDVIVALDDRSLELVADAAQALNSSVEIYGIGSTNKIVHYLDYGVINAIVFQNEFNMGYLSIQELKNEITDQKKVPDVDIEFRTVNKETMYLPKNQRLVFPIVQ